jgi:hypothetical protein
MAIAYDSGQWMVAVTGATGMTGTAHTVTGTNTLLLIGIWSAVSLTSPAVTYNGVSMTLIASFNIPSATFLHLFGLLSPTTGSAISPIATWSSAGSVKAIYSASYSGVSQSALPSVTHNSNVNTATSLSATLTTDSTANSWVAMFLRNEFNDFNSISTGALRAHSNNADATAFADSNGVVTASASFSTTLGWVGNGNTQAGAISIEINPAAIVIPTASPAFLLNFI